LKTNNQKTVNTLFQLRIYEFQLSKGLRFGGKYVTTGKWCCYRFSLEISHCNSLYRGSWCWGTKENFFKVFVYMWK